MIRLLLPALVVLAACDSDTVTTLENPGRACLVADAADVGMFEQPGNTTLAADAEAVVVVVVSDCSSGSVQWENVCSAMVNGADIEVAATAISTAPSAQTADCQVVTVACPVAALGAGTYSLNYAGVEAPITIPYTGEPICVDAS